MTRDRGVPPRDQSRAANATPISGEDLPGVRRSIYKNLDELLFNPGTSSLENYAYRGQLPINRAMDTNIGFLAKLIHPRMETFLRTNGGGELVWMDGSRAPDSGAVRYSLAGLEYLDKDARELLKVPGEKPEGKFLWTPEGEVDPRLKDEIVASGDPSVVGFSQLRLTELIHGAMLLVGTPDLPYLGKPGGRRTFYTNPPSFLFGPLQLRRDPRLIFE